TANERVAVLHHHARADEADAGDDTGQSLWRCLRDGGGHCGGGATYEPERPVAGRGAAQLALEADHEREREPGGNASEERELGRQYLAHTAREPETTGFDTAVVDRDEDRDDAIDAGVRGLVLVRAESGAARLLVIQLVLERDCGLAERSGGAVLQHAVDQGFDP